MPDQSEAHQGNKKFGLTMFYRALRIIFVKFFQSLRWLTENTINLLRLFATLALFLIVIFVVFNAIRGSNSVVVKPFLVPESMSQVQSNTGRIIANMLKQILKEEERRFNRTVNPTNGESSQLSGSLGESSSSITDDSVSLGANIKLPETGISISDVVEFISSIFGRESITGSVYEDNNKLHLQIELKSQVFTFERELSEKNKLARLDLIQDMLQESRKSLLSVASADFNLNYYCTDEVDIVAYSYGKHKKWFDYCSTLRSPDITAKKIKHIQNELEQFSSGLLTRDDRFYGYMATLVKGRLYQKALLVCRPEDGCDGAQVMVADNRSPASILDEERATSAYSMEAPAPAPMTLPVEVETREKMEGSLATETPAPQAVERATEMHLKAVEVTPRINIAVLKEQCTGSKAVLTMQQMRPAQSAEEDATLLFRNKRYQEAVETYVRAIDADCHYPKAWANLGVLLTFADKQTRDYVQAQEALKFAIELSPDSGWMYHSLCIAEAFAKPTGSMLEKSIGSESCVLARQLDPAKTVLYDKLFYIAVADRYIELEKYPQAYKAYLASMQTDKKEDCRMGMVVKQLLKLENEYGIEGAEAAACGIIGQSYSIDQSPSECQEELNALKEGCLKM